MKIAITGATGFVGSRLVAKLHPEAQEILILTRNVAKAEKVFPASAFPKLKIIAYNPTKSGDWQQSLSGYDAVINLAGAAIAEQRWTASRKQEILDSRQLGTRNLVGAIQQANPRPQVLISTSAIGYYGTSETATFTEASPPGQDFLAEVCQKWETEAQKVHESNTRLVILRFGIVLGKEGGALAKMLTPFHFFGGGPIGSGQQWMSWIHRDDLVNLIITALKRNDMAGIYNATAPNPVKMSEFCQTLGQVMQRPSWLPVPGFALELLLGEGAKLVLEGQKVIPQQTETTGFQFQYPTIKTALTQILNPVS